MVVRNEMMIMMTVVMDEVHHEELNQVIIELAMEQTHVLGIEITES